MDEPTFFRDVVAPLCVNVDFQVALRGCLRALSRYVPAEGLVIFLMEPGLKSSRTIFVSADAGREYVNRIIPLSPETRRYLKGSPLPDRRIINRPELDPVCMCPPFHEEAGTDWSGLAMFLFDKGKRLGVAVLNTQGRDRYEEEHLSLFSLLHDPLVLVVSKFLQRLEVLKLKDMLDEDTRFPGEELRTEDIIGHDQGLRNVMDMVRHGAASDSPVLLLGETGVGKDLIANAIHHTSPRRNGPLIRVNCGAIPETLVDSELFGHEKGAFTGAIAQRRGRFERADHGTIFLDEIGDLRHDIQVKLLRVLQNREIERVGGTQALKVDVRVIAATHRNLESMIAAGEFREDLWFRVNVFPIMIPPLRGRKGDIPALVDHFIQRKSRELKLHPPPPLARGAIDRLMAYHWPGNVRELENVVERALILSRGEPLTFRELESAWKARRPLEPAPDPEESLDLDRVISAHIRKVLVLTKGRINGPGGAAQLLGLHPNTLRNRMDRLGVSYGRRRRASPMRDAWAGRGSS